ncbi:MAG TPA: hypothetical protein VL171_07640 [Verrucomicrobiae bacterium]|nr:hypothetical protein [Verrucomicrobiae bacterium]
MAKRLTVFYSWQSDSPPNLNRNFIEKALTEALARLHSDATLENALRDTTVELDKDTKGVAGSPPITETILRKVEECAVFVADLTFIGQSKDQLTNSAGKTRQFPNPNVLIEYGYALKCHTHARLVGIMNTAYGKPDAESLPFDLRHLRWPITYRLAHASAEDKDDQFERLVEALVEAVGLILSTSSSTSTKAEPFVPRQSTKSAAIFFDNAKDLLPEDNLESLLVPDGGKAYLRVCPTIGVPPIETELEAKSLAVTGYLQPMGRVKGYGVRRNTFGAVVCESPQDGKLFHFTQLFLNREVWAVDARFLNADHQRAMNDWLGVPQSRPYIAGNYLEQYFVLALQNYLTFAQAHLHIPEPLRIEAGLVGIKGYAIAVDNNGERGSALHDTIQWQGEVNYERPAWEILLPFFNKVWANCGVPRTSARQDDLIRQIQFHG